MRRQYFFWTYLVTAIVLTVYGGYSIIYNINHGKDLSILGLVFCIIGITMLIVYLVLILINFIQKKNRPVVKEKTEIEEKVEEPVVEEKPKQGIVGEEDVGPAYSTKTDYSYVRDTDYEKPRPSRRFSGGSGYVRKVGYGPVLRVEEEEILDMRSNTYYRIEGNIVKMLGSGPAFEISGNRIRAAFGGYLYEISGSNVNKTYGGYYASFSGGYLQTHDLSEKYEVPDSLNMAQKLAVVALLFGSY